MTLTSTGVYSRVVEALVARLKGHITDGGLLEGFKIEDKPVQRVEGDRDFPKIYIALPNMIGVTHSRNIGDAGMTLRIVVATSNKESVAQFVENFEKVCDALETNHETDEADLTLHGTLARPMDTSTVENYVAENGLTYNAQIPLSVIPLPFTRGRRRL